MTLLEVPVETEPNPRQPQAADTLKPHGAFLDFQLEEGMTAYNPSGPFVIDKETGQIGMLVRHEEFTSETDFEARLFLPDASQDLWVPDKNAPKLILQDPFNCG